MNNFKFIGIFTMAILAIIGVLKLTIMSPPSKYKCDIKIDGKHYVSDGTIRSLDVNSIRFKDASNGYITTIIGNKILYACEEIIEEIEDD